MAWIKTVPIAEASAELLDALAGQAKGYPAEYEMPVDLSLFPEKNEQGERIVLSHSLIPQALYHAFSTFGSLLSPELPLTRRQHELIAATVSSLNSCFY